MHHGRHLDREDGEPGLPPQVQALAPRMRQISGIIYSLGVATAKDVHARIDDDITIFGIRTLLRRLVRKGIIAQRSSGRHSEVAYVPAIQTDELRREALEKLVEQHFGGSLEQAIYLAGALSFFGDERPWDSRLPPAERAIRHNG